MGNLENNIIRIVISGFTDVNSFLNIYDGKLMITQNGIEYKKAGKFDVNDDSDEKWSYRTNSRKFRELYEELVKIVSEIFSEEAHMLLDLPSTTISLMLSDKTRLSRNFLFRDYDVMRCFSVVRKMYPQCETIPEGMLDDDYDYR